MNRKIIFEKHPQWAIAAALLTFGICGAWVFKTKTDLKSLAKRAIDQEFEDQIRLVVRKEVEAYFAAAKQEASSRPGHITVAEGPKRPGLQQNVAQKVREAFSEELDNYAAGALENQVSAGTCGVNVKAEDSGRSEVSETEEGVEGITGGKTKERMLERVVVEKGGMVLPKGKLQIEPSFTLAHFSSNRINIQGFSILPVLVIGEISTEAVKRDVFMHAWSLKYGAWRNSQIDLKVPYRFEYDRVNSNTGQESNRRLGGLGDVELGWSHQIFVERGLVPDTLFNISVKAPTGRSPYNTDIGLGTGHWGMRAALIAVKSSDPAVVFGNVNYTWNIKREIDNYGEMDPGDSVGYGLGAAIGLSYQTAINFAFDHSATFKMKRNGHNVKGTFLHVANLKVGFTWAISEKASIDFAVSRGLTNDSPDFVVEFRFPYTF